MANSLFAPGRGRWLALALLGALAGGCAPQPPMRQSATHIGPEAAPVQGAIPAPVQISPVLPKPKPTPKPETYSVVVKDVDVYSLLFAVARDAKLNIDIDPRISDLNAHVTLNAVDQTLPQLLTRISKQVPIRWELEGSILTVTRDEPFIRIYKVDYVNIERKVTTSVEVKSEIGGAPTTGGAGGAGAAGAAAGGGTKIQISQENVFWKTLVSTINQLMQEEDRLLPTVFQPRAGSAAASSEAGARGAGQAGAAIGGPAGSGAAGAGSEQAQGRSSAAAPEQARAGQAQQNVIANPDAGVLMVRATARVHEKVQAYIDQVISRGRRQVLIEATVAEVQLNNNYQQGIDWSLFRRGGAGLTLAQSAQGTTAAAVNSSLLVMNYVASGVSATLRLLDSFGNVRVLSSPKISVLNNQTAILKVVDNIVYFTIKADTTSTANVGTTTVFTTTPQVQPVGFVMNVTPQINETDTVLLNLRPAVTRLLGFVNDPNPSLAVAGTTNRIPQVQTREMESMISVNSGQIAIMGGLIQDSINDAEDAVPGLRTDPVFGPFFTHRNRVNAKTELVVFIRPVVVKDPSIDGDFRALRNYLPDENFIAAPNPGKTPPRPSERP